MLETPEVNGARQALPCLETPEINGARQSVAVVEKYVDGAWQEVWRNIQPVEIKTNSDFNGEVIAKGNDISISFATSAEDSNEVTIDISGTWSLPIITGTLTFSSGGSGSDYDHENISWFVRAYDTSGNVSTYDLPSSSGQHDYEYSAEVFLAILLEIVTHLQICMCSGTYSDEDALVETALLGLKIDDVPYGTDITL